MDTATICPVCLQENVYSGGYCRACKKNIHIDLPVGVLPPGVVLHGRYLTGIFLGSGGFGTIYKALDMQSGKIVAVKEYFPSIWCHRKSGISAMTVTSPEEYEYGLKHFNGEAEILRALQGIQEVVRCYQSFPENNTAYYVMEFLEGETLQHYLKTHRERIGFSDAVSLLIPVILGMEKVHRAGATHRDLSPDNIFLCRDGSVRIIDFGASASKESMLSRSFIPVEKEGYSPPEQHTISSRGDMQGPWSDVYAMAGTMYRCTVGRRPPSSSSRQAGDELEFAHSGLTQQQIGVLNRALALKPEERTRSMLIFARELADSLPRAEAESLRGKYRELSSSGRPSEIREEKKPPDPPPEKREEMAGRRTLAFALDMLFFQAMPAALGLLFGGAVWPWLLLGIIVGVMTSWLMTVSNLRAGPGEILCGLEVRGSGGIPPRREAMLFCLCRMIWPIAAADGLCRLITNRELITELSGCREVRRERGTTQKKLVLMVTNGLYQGSVIPLEEGRYVFGRNPDRCNLVFPMAYNVVSRVHFELIVDAAGQITLTNLSGHGTWIDARRLGMNESAAAVVGAAICFGNERMVITTI